MKKYAFCRLSPLFAVAFAVLFAAPCLSLAQEKQVVTPAMVAIKKITGVTGNEWRQKTPNVGTKPAGKQREWGVIDAEFDLAANAPKFIDELVVNFTVMLQVAPNTDIRLVDGKKFSLLKLSVRYADVESGRGKKVGAVILPNAILRYGVPVGIAVDLVVDGKTIASKSEQSGDLKNVKGRWWEDPKVVDSSVVAKREGLLVDRAKTPFSLVSIDEYEVSK